MAAGYRPLPTQLSVSGDDTEERAIQEVYRYESQKKDPQTKVPPDKRSPRQKIPHDFWMGQFTSPDIRAAYNNYTGQKFPPSFSLNISNVTQLL